MANRGRTLDWTQIKSQKLKIHILQGNSNVGGAVMAENKYNLNYLFFGNNNCDQISAQIKTNTKDIHTDFLIFTIHTGCAVYLNYGKLALYHPTLLKSLYYPPKKGCCLHMIRQVEHKTLYIR